MTKTPLLLASLALVACSSRTMKLGRDAGSSDQRLPTADGVAVDGPAAPDQNQGPSETSPETAFFDLGARLPEVLGDDAARVDATEVPPGEASAPDQPGPRDATVNESGSESGAVDAAFVDGMSDAPLETATEVPPLVVDGALASFCLGSSAHMIVNGIESHPGTKAAQLCYECCAGGDITVVTATFSEPVQFAWRGLNFGSNGPEVLDLANPPKDWQFSLVAGCDPTITSFECGPPTTSCANPGKVYESGFWGTLELARTSNNKADATLCLHFESPAGAPSPTIQTLDLYAPHVVWRN